MKPLSLLKLAAPAALHQKGEWLWSVTQTEDTTKILSVAMGDGPYQHGDIVRFETHPEIEDCGRAVELVTAGGFALHRVFGAKATPMQCMALTEHMREQDLHIEVWSLTVRAADEEPGEAPMRAGLVVQPGMDALEAMLRLRRGMQLASITAWCPTLSEAAGDQVGLQRDRKGLRGLGLAA
jgi:hypothetical protein